MMDRPEFKIGDIVTVDRYNHIDDVSKGKINGYDRTMLSGRLSYLIDINGLEISTTGLSIMESKNYRPADPEDRHPKIFRPNESNKSIR